MQLMVQSLLFGMFCLCYSQWAEAQEDNQWALTWGTAHVEEPVAKPEGVFELYNPAQLRNMPGHPHQQRTGDSAVDVVGVRFTF